MTKYFSFLIGCDVVVEQSGILIESIKTNGVYANNQLCTTTISNPEGCLSIEFLSFELQNSIGNECTADYLEVQTCRLSAPLSNVSYSLEKLKWP